MLEAIVLTVQSGCSKRLEVLGINMVSQILRMSLSKMVQGSNMWKVSVLDQLKGQKQDKE